MNDLEERVIDQQNQIEILISEIDRLRNLAGQSTPAVTKHVENNEVMIEEYEAQLEMANQLQDRLKADLTECKENYNNLQQRFASFEKEAVELSRENNTASIELSQLKHKLSEKEGEIEALTRQTQVLQRTQREADAHLWWKYVWSELRRLKSTEFGEKGTSNFVDQQSLPKNLCQDPVQAQALEILSLRQQLLSTQLRHRSECDKLQAALQKAESELQHKEHEENKLLHERDLKIAEMAQTIRILVSRSDLQSHLVSARQEVEVEKLSNLHLREHAEVTRRQLEKEQAKVLGLRAQLDEVRAIFNAEQVVSTLKGIPSVDASTLLEIQAGNILKIHQELEHTKKVLEATLSKFGSVNFTSTLPPLQSDSCCSNTILLGTSQTVDDFGSLNKPSNTNLAPMTSAKSMQQNITSSFNGHSALRHSIDLALRGSQTIENRGNPPDVDLVMVNLRLELALLQKKLEAKDETIESLLRQLENVKNEVASFEESSQQLQALYQYPASSLLAKSEREKLQEEMEKLRAELNLSRASENQEHQRISLLQEQLLLTQGQVQSLRACLNGESHNTNNAIGVMESSWDSAQQEMPRNNYHQQTERLQYELKLKTEEARVLSRTLNIFQQISFLNHPNIQSMADIQKAIDATISPTHPQIQVQLPTSSPDRHSSIDRDTVPRVRKPPLPLQNTNRQTTEVKQSQPLATSSSASAVNNRSGVDKDNSKTQASFKLPALHSSEVSWCIQSLIKRVAELTSEALAKSCEVISRNSRIRELESDIIANSLQTQAHSTTIQKLELSQQKLLFEISALQQDSSIRVEHHARAVSSFENQNANLLDRIKDLETQLQQAHSSLQENNLNPRNSGEISLNQRDKFWILELISNDQTKPEVPRAVLTETHPLFDCSISVNRNRITEPNFSAISALQKNVKHEYSGDSESNDVFNLLNKNSLENKLLIYETDNATKSTFITAYQKKLSNSLQQAFIWRQRALDAERIVYENSELPFNVSDVTCRLLRKHLQDTRLHLKMTTNQLHEAQHELSVAQSKANYESATIRTLQAKNAELESFLITNKANGIVTSNSQLIDQLPKELQEQIKNWAELNIPSLVTGLPITESSFSTFPIENVISPVAASELDGKSLVDHVTRGLLVDREYALTQTLISTQSIVAAKEMEYSVLKDQTLQIQSRCSDLQNIVKKFADLESTSIATTGQSQPNLRTLQDNISPMSGATTDESSSVLLIQQLEQDNAALRIKLSHLEKSSHKLQLLLKFISDSENTNRNQMDVHIAKIQLNLERQYAHELQKLRNTYALEDQQLADTLRSIVYDPRDFNLNTSNNILPNEGIERHSVDDMKISRKLPKSTQRDRGLGDIQPITRNLKTHTVSTKRKGTSPLIGPIATVKGTSAGIKQLGKKHNGPRNVPGYSTPRTVEFMLNELGELIQGISSPHSRAGGVSSEMVKAAYNYCQRVSAAVQCLEITAQLTKTAAPVNSILELVNQFQGFEMNRDDENEFQVSEYKRELINSQTRAAIVESDLRSSLAKAEADKDALEKRVIDLMAENDYNRNSSIEVKRVYEGTIRSLQDALDMQSKATVAEIERLSALLQEVRSQDKQVSSKFLINHQREEKFSDMGRESELQKLLEEERKISSVLRSRLDSYSNKFRPLNQSLISDDSVDAFIENLPNLIQSATSLRHSAKEAINEGKESNKFSHAVANELLILSDKEISKLITSIIFLQRLRKAAAAENFELKTALEKERAERKDLADEISRKGALIANLRKTRTEIATSEIQNTAEVKQLRESNKSLQNSCNTKERLVKDLKQQLENVNMELNLLKRPTEQSDQAAKIIELENERNRIRTHVTSLRTKIRQFEIEMRKKDEELEKLQIKSSIIDNLKLSLERREGICNGLKQQLIDCQKYLEEITTASESNLSAAEKKIRQLQRQLDLQVNTRQSEQKLHDGTATPKIIQSNQHDHTIQNNNIVNSLTVQSYIIPGSSQERYSTQTMEELNSFIGSPQNSTASVLSVSTPQATTGSGGDLADVMQALGL